MNRIFNFAQWATVDPVSGWQFTAGDFTGDARTDVMGYHPSNGTLWVGENAGTAFTFQKWATVSPVADWQFVAGFFEGGPKADVCGYHPSNGSLWVGQNTGTGFTFNRWATVAPVDGWQFVAGNFRGSGRTDVVGYHPSNGTLWVGRNTGNSFTFKRWATVDPVDGWQFVAGDFTGNGRTDVVGYHPSNGTLWVGENTGMEFTFREWATVSPVDRWQFASGYFTRRAKADVVGYHPSNGTLWVGENGDTQFTFEQWGSVTPVDNWQFVTGMLDADLWADVAGYHPSNGSLWVGKSVVRPIEGYCWPLSGAAGENISFKISGDGPSTASFYRETSISGAIDSVHMSDLTFVAAPQAVPSQPWRDGCGWSETFCLTVPDSWPSGMYSAKCIDASSTQCDITFMVKPSPALPSGIAVLANVNTWLAYNGWGGQSKYSGLARTSFLRPIQGASVGSSHLSRGELWVLGWLESEGHRPDVFTDIDFHNDGCDASQYPLLVMTTHPEYWSTTMYDNLMTYLDAGGCLAYLGGNGIFEYGTYDEDQTVMVFRNGVEGEARQFALFRVTATRPERSILGVATERCSVMGTGYRVRKADHALFAGIRIADPITGVERAIRNGDLFGDAGLNTGWGNGKASAWEVDTSEGPFATDIPECARDGGSLPSVPASTLPAGLVVLARADADAGGLGADMIYYDHSGGGFVFSVGSITFGGSLVVDSVIQQLMRNLLIKAGI